MSIFQTIAGLFRGGPQPSATVRSLMAEAAALEASPSEVGPAAGRTLKLQNAKLTTVDIPAEADIAIDLSDNPELRQLPDGIHTGSLSLARCTGLKSLPAGIDVAFLDLSGCTGLTELPHDLRLRGGSLKLSGCTGLSSLPDDLGEVAGLDLSGCQGVAALPQGLVVTSWIDVAGSGIIDLPEFFDPVGVRWNGVPVSRKTAFAPHTITKAEIAAERDRKVRKVMEQRAG